MKKLLKKLKWLIGILPPDAKALHDLIKAVKEQQGKPVPEAACAVQPQVIRLIQEIGNDFPEGSKGRAIIADIERKIAKGYDILC
jgi:hypothetical protein